MSDDDTPQARAFALARFRARLTDDEAGPDDVSEIQTTIVADVLIAHGAPTASVRFHLSPDGVLLRSEYVTTEHRYAGFDGYGDVTAPIPIGEAVEAAELWAGGIDALTDTALSTIASGRSD